MPDFSRADAIVAQVAWYPHQTSEAVATYRLLVSCMKRLLYEMAHAHAGREGLSMDNIGWYYTVLFNTPQAVYRDFELALQIACRKLECDHRELQQFVSQNIHHLI
jgi:hypothetical protein